jgi:hypothetical protein
MADLSLVTANTVRPGTLTNVQHTAVAGEAITAGAPCHFDGTTGKVYNSDANDASHDTCWGVSLRTVGAGEGVTLLRKGWLFGVDVSGLDFGAGVYVSNTKGRLADAAGSASILVGMVLPVFGEQTGTTAAKGIYVDVFGLEGQYPSIGSGSTIATPTLTLTVEAVAAAGSDQAGAGAITSGSGAFIHATGADGTKGILLPTAAAGKFYIIKNSDAANAILKVYPNTSDAINEIAADTAMSVAAKKAAIFVALDATTWQTVPLLPS